MIEEWQYELKLGNEKAPQRAFSNLRTKSFFFEKSIIVSLFHLTFLTTF